MRERWKVCAGFPAYEVSSLGQVRQRHTGRLLCASDHKGYRRVNLQRAGVWTKKLVHVLVWTTFRGRVPRGKEIDHRNRRKHVCRLTNLRTLKHSENLMNSAGRNRRASRYKGVTWCKARSRWQAQIKTGGKNLFLGRFTNEQQAGRAYNRAARQHFGRFAVINFKGKHHV